MSNLQLDECDNRILRAAHFNFCGREVATERTGWSARAERFAQAFIRGAKRDSNFGDILEDWLKVQSMLDAAAVQFRSDPGSLEKFEGFIATGFLLLHECVAGGPAPLLQL